MAEVGNVHVKVTADTSQAMEAFEELESPWEPRPFWVSYASLLGIAFIVGWLVTSALR